MLVFHDIVLGNCQFSTGCLQTNRNDVIGRQESINEVLDYRRVGNGRPPGGTLS